MEAVAVGLLGEYAAVGPLALPFLAVASAMTLWACALGETVGHSLADVGAQQFLDDRRRQVIEVLYKLRRWSADTRREPRAGRQHADISDG